MEIWLNSADGVTSSSEGIDRVWSGSATDVSEVVIEDDSSQNDALSLIGMVPWLLVRCSDWTMIPLENLVATSRGSGTRIAAAVNQEIDLNGAVFALDHGVDAILVEFDLLEAAILAASEKAPVEYTENEQKSRVQSAKITSIESGGVGERVCIDLTVRLQEGQGIATGSVSQLLCIVHGETLSNEFVPPRPFRVNAGAIHSYALMADGKTKYLSELNSGDEIAVLSSEGIVGKAAIGRLKIEKRPLMIIRFEVGEVKSQIIAQQAETVRLIAPEGGVLPITSAALGDNITVFSDNRVRHIGQPLEGRVNER
ncbi:MAG: 3-dehydroquinate synthase II [Candidatus Thermoplasmatota archaeon]|nr:3-dehydroquinate synthase II [Candidatus Thermoplasmatota archaeon]